jgi:hypothetical protein
VVELSGAEMACKWKSGVVCRALAKWEESEVFLYIYN